MNLLKENIKSYSLREKLLKIPILTCLGIYALAIVFRILDIFYLRIEEAWGEIALSKVMGIFLILTFLYLVQKKLSNIGFHSRYFKENLYFGLGSIITAFAIAYAVEFLYLFFQGVDPVMILKARGHTLTPESAVTGGFVLAFWLIMGNIVNSFMEEGLFRGVMIPLAANRLTLLQANLFQAGLFGIWHIVWPVKSVLDGSMDISSAIGISIGYIILSGLIGFTWGIMYINTGSLWGAWFAHTFNNTALNLIHIQTISGINEMQSLRIILITVIFIILVSVFKNKIIKPQPENLISENHNYLCSGTWLK